MGCHIWQIRLHNCDKVVWKYLGFQLLSPKTRRRKFFGCPTLQPRSHMTFSIQLNKKQMDPRNMFADKKRQISEMHWAMGLVGSVSKKFKNFSFYFNKNCGEYFSGKSYHNIPLKWIIFHRLMQKYYAFRSLL